MHFRTAAPAVLVWTVQIMYIQPSERPCRYGKLLSHAVNTGEQLWHRMVGIFAQATGLAFPSLDCRDCVSTQKSGADIIIRIPRTVYQLGLRSDRLHWSLCLAHVMQKLFP